MQKFSIKNRHNQNILGYYKQAHTPKALAFIQHGFSGYKEQSHLQAMQETLLNNHISVVNFDATNSFGESEGFLEHFTLTQHCSDLEDVIKWASFQDWYKEPFILVGHSMGAASCLNYACTHPKKVKALAPTSAVVSGKALKQTFQTHAPELIQEIEKKGYALKQSSSRPNKVGKITKGFFDDTMKYDFIQDASKIKAPCLLIVGTKDDVTLPKHQKTLGAKLGESVHQMKGAGHTFKSEPELASLKQIMNDWLNGL